MGKENLPASRYGQNKLTLGGVLPWLLQDGIANIVSKSYAERLKIMPVKVDEHEVTIATAEPFITDWVAELERILNLKIKLVLASPLDINHYLPEIYSLANSVQLANQARTGQSIGVQNFEQLVELGKNK